MDTSFLTKGAKEDLPQSYEEAIKGPEVDKWKEAMDAEMSQKNEMGAWKKRIYLKNRKQLVVDGLLQGKRTNTEKLSNTKPILLLKDFCRSLEPIIWIMAPLHQ